MNALLSRVLETFTSLQGKRNTVKSTRITVTAVEHERHNAGSARLVNRKWSDDLAHDELVITLKSKHGSTELVFNAFDGKDEVKSGHGQNGVSYFFAKVTEEQDIDILGWCIEHVAIAE
jgi:hypothetical protein